MCIKSSYQHEERNPQAQNSTKRQSPWLIRVVSHPNCSDPGELYLSHCAATHSTEEERWTKGLPLSDLPSCTDPNTSRTEGRNAFSKRSAKNDSPELPSFHIQHNCCVLHSLQEDMLQIQAKKCFCPGLLETLYLFACPHK